MLFIHLSIERDPVVVGWDARGKGTNESVNLLIVILGNERIKRLNGWVSFINRLENMLEIYDFVYSKH